MTGGGLTANSPYFLGRLVDQPDPNSVRYSLYLSAADAARGTTQGALRPHDARSRISNSPGNTTPLRPVFTDQAADAVKIPRGE